MNTWSMGLWTAPDTSQSHSGLLAACLLLSESQGWALRVRDHSRLCQFIKFRSVAISSGSHVFSHLPPKLKLILVRNDPSVPALSTYTNIVRDLNPVSGRKLVLVEFQLIHNLVDIHFSSSASPGQIGTYGLSFETARGGIVTTSTSMDIKNHLRLSKTICCRRVWNSGHIGYHGLSTWSF